MTNLQDTPSTGLLTAADFDRQLTAAVPPARYPACVTGTCRQGRAPCPTPQACQVPQADEDGSPRRQRMPEGGGLALLLVVGLTAAAVAVHLLARLM